MNNIWPIIQSICSNSYLCGPTQTTQGHSCCQAQPKSQLSWAEVAVLWPFPTATATTPRGFKEAKFATFIDTRGLKYCWKVIGHCLESPSTHHFWHKRWCCSWWPLPIYAALCFHLQLIDTKTWSIFWKFIRHCWESHSTSNFGTSAGVAVGPH